MKVVKGHRWWWVGKRIECGKCHTVFELKSGDRKKVKDAKRAGGMGTDGWEQDTILCRVPCPKCKKINELGKK